jgi:hypothetical protein
MIPFKYGTQEQYDAQVKDNSALYFISDTKRIYRGEELISGVEALVVDELPSFKSAIDGIIYVYLENGTNAKLYVKGEEKMVPISAEVEDGGIQSVDAFDPDMVTKSTDDLANADDDSLITAGAVKAAVEEATGTWEYLDGVADSSKVYG